MQTRREDLGRNQRGGSPVDALVDVVQSGQDVVLHRLEVLRLEAERRLEGLRDETLGLVCAGLLVSSAWILLLASAVVFLSRPLGLGGAFAALGVVNLVVGLAVTRIVRSRGARKPTVTATDAGLRAGS